MERFAGLTPGLMLVLGADITPEDIEEYDKEHEEEHKALKILQPLLNLRWFRADYDLTNLVDWLNSARIHLKRYLGGGFWGGAFEIDSDKYGKGLALKISAHESEKKCVEWIYNNHSRYDMSNLPRIYEVGDLPDMGHDAFYYIRPMYEMIYITDDEADDFAVKLLKQTDGEFYGWDVKSYNVGEDPQTGKKIYFDPACYLPQDKGYQAIVDSFLEDQIIYKRQGDVEGFLKDNDLTLEQVLSWVSDDSRVAKQMKKKVKIEA